MPAFGTPSIEISSVEVFQNFRCCSGPRVAEARGIFEFVRGKLDNGRGRFLV